MALELGLLAGVGAAVLALGLVGIWTLSTTASLDAVGMFTRGVAFLPVGIVAGHLADRMRDAGDRQHLLLQSGLTLAHRPTPTIFRRPLHTRRASWLHAAGRVSS